MIHRQLCCYYDQQDTEAHIHEARATFRRLKCLNSKVRALRSLIESICGHYNHTVSIDKLMSGLFGILVCRMWTSLPCHTYSQAEITQDRELLSIYYNEGLQAVRSYTVISAEGEPRLVRLKGLRPDVRLGSDRVQSAVKMLELCLYIVVGEDVVYDDYILQQAEETAEAVAAASVGGDVLAASDVIP
eukprot:GHVQ01033582.1.p1 GENE.GHVQ01033582.1~~GHVQ01033582.1.p1  ORF type:complete len:188 (-),score=23.26 GHVQ01033582.1:138-701(-)